MQWASAALERRHASLQFAVAVGPLVALAGFGEGCAGRGLSVLRRWLSWAPEAAALLPGIWLRLRFAANHDPTWGYDAYSHLAYLEWVAWKRYLPPITAFRAAYHAPLYYWIGGAALRHRWSLQAVRSISTIAGCGKLFLIAWGLRRHLPGATLARVTALAHPDRHAFTRPQS